jgi:hypothetical protein|tara:strand:- start:3054 stop:3221 length:168 start_codon:yes stop_codon:yes gene_type:complete
MVILKKFLINVNSIFKYLYMKIFVHITPAGRKYAKEYKEKRTKELTEIIKQKGDA